MGVPHAGDEFHALHQRVQHEREGPFPHLLPLLLDVLDFPVLESGDASSDS